MLTFESRTSSPLQQRVWELSYSRSYDMETSALPATRPSVLSSTTWSRTCGGRRSERRRRAGGPARLSVPLHDKSSELAAPQHRGLCSPPPLPKPECCLSQADGSGLGGLAQGKRRQREEGREERDAEQKEGGEIFKKGPSGTVGKKSIHSKSPERSRTG